MTCFYISLRNSCLFFFQAEDGIRDIGVTGVQTCALPIWSGHSPLAAHHSHLSRNVRPGSIPVIGTHPGRTSRAKRPRRATGPFSAGEGLLGLQAGDRVEVAQDRGELVGGPRLAAVAPAVGVAGEAEQATGLVLLNGEVAGDRVAVAGAARGAQPQTPAGDDDRAAVVPDLAHLEDGRLATPAHGVLPPVPEKGTCVPLLDRSWTRYRRDPCTAEYRDRHSPGFRGDALPEARVIS